METLPKQDPVSPSPLSIGSQLRLIRENKNMGLHELSQRTKVGRTILKAIEEDDHKNMPQKTYLRGFIKSYLREMGVDPKEILEQFDLANGNKKRILVDPAPQKVIVREKIKEKIKEKTPSHKKNRAQSTLLSLSAIFVGLGIFYYVNQGKDMATVSAPPKMEEGVKENLPQEVAPKVYTITNPVYFLEYSVLTGQFIWRPLRPFSLVTSKDLPKIGTPGGVVGEKELTPSSKEKNLSPYPYVEFSPIKKANYYLDPLPEGESVAWESWDNTKGVHLKIQALESDTWVTYQLDHGGVSVKTLKKGSELELHGDELVVFMGNYHTSKVYYNNQVVRSNWGTGVKTFIYPPSASLKYKLPVFVRPGDGKMFTAQEYEKLMGPKPNLTSPAL